jgi:hypothetical protein
MVLDMDHAMRILQPINHTEQQTMNHPLNVLRHHVSGAIARGDKVAIVEQTTQTTCPNLMHYERDELIAYLRMSQNQRKQKLSELRMAAQTSGSLLHAMRYLLTA